MQQKNLKGEKTMGIKFGTDGWRAVIDKDFTNENVCKIIQAFCDVWADSPNKLVFIGYDRRNKSDSTSRLVASVLAANGFEPRLSKQYCPTPCVSWLSKNNDGLAGVMVTASHNPPNWNGIKFKESYGGAASPEYTDKIEAQIEANEKAGRKPLEANFEECVAKGSITYYDPHETYSAHLKNYMDVEKITQSGFKVVVDPMFGSGTDYIKSIINQGVVQIHEAADPDFGGLSPEPIEKNLSDLRKAVLENKAHIGLATDGDADRIGAMDEKGNYISSHQIFALLLRHNLDHNKLKGTIVSSVSTTRLIQEICTKYALEHVQTPIGFKHISKVLKERDALMGGEESGGISFRDHVHERDGVFNGLLLLEMMAVKGKSLSELISEMNDEYGKFIFKRDDHHLDSDTIERVRNQIKGMSFDEVEGVKVLKNNTLDGLRLEFEDGSWVLMRPSGTEPLVRTYAEASSMDRVDALLRFVKNELTL